MSSDKICDLSDDCDDDSDEGEHFLSRVGDYTVSVRPSVGPSVTSFVKKTRFQLSKDVSER